MQRIAVFVDAGYLIARGAESLTATPTGRRGVILDERKIIDALILFAENKAKCNNGILRVYWYDAAGSQPTAEQIRLAELDNVKLRLGTLNSLGKQKGVDSLIIADMIELARNAGVGDFLLVGGDEDLRIGVQIAQTYGTRVHLLGVDIAGDRAQSPGLAREADTTSGWTNAEVSTFLSIRPAPPIAVPAAVPASPPVSPSTATVTLAASDSLKDTVRAFCKTLAQTDIDDIKTVWETSKTIPQPYDGRLLASTATAMNRQLDVSERREMRHVLIELLQNSGWGQVP